MTPLATWRVAISVRSGQVPSIEKPAAHIAAQVPAKTREGGRAAVAGRCQLRSAQTQMTSEPSAEAKTWVAWAQNPLAAYSQESRKAMACF